MSYKTINPYTGEVTAEFKNMTDEIPEHGSMPSEKPYRIRTHGTNHCGHSGKKLQ